jgi:hypothetical protein
MDSDSYAWCNFDIGGNSRHNGCVDVYTSHNPCETWYDSDEEVHHRVRPLMKMKKKRRENDEA